MTSQNILQKFIYKNSFNRSGESSLLKLVVTLIVITIIFERFMLLVYEYMKDSASTAVVSIIVLYTMLQELYNK